MMQIILQLNPLYTLSTLTPLVCFHYVMLLFDIFDSIIWIIILHSYLVHIHGNKDNLLLSGFPLLNLLRLAPRVFRAFLRNGSLLILCHCCFFKGRELHVCVDRLVE